ncbi:MAG TPA: HAD-IA family hydrolase [Sedimentisphaerales bacterium]|nr:HAD-IA family hydrolase [Sedimentisphaerales bacterium]
MSVKAVIFDLDGTITRPFFDFDAIRVEMGLGKEAGPVWEAMSQMAPGQRRRAEEILDSYEQRAVTESQLNPGASETLEELRRAGIRIGVLTRNRRSNALAVARKHGLEFDAVVDREDGPVKPDAFGVLRLCEQFGVAPQEAIVVGDYLFDLLCAKAAGAAAVLLVNNNRAAEFADRADITIQRIDEVLRIVQDSNSVQERKRNYGKE